MSEKSKSSNLAVSALLEDLKKGFIADIPDKLDSMESIILSMEKGIEFSDNYEKLYRQTHSLKGSAGSYGLHFITSICHSMEDSLHEVDKKQNIFDQYGGAYWLKYIDLLRAVLGELENGSEKLDLFEQQLSLLQSIRPGGHSYQLHCLVVTTSALYTSLFPSTFENVNIKFSFANDGYNALGRLLSENFDVVISDYETPMLNGLSLFGAIRLSDSRNKRIKTILMSSKIHPSLTRNTDPDFVVKKDKDFTDNLTKAIMNVIDDPAVVTRLSAG